MIDESKYIFRDATTKDVDFIATAIIEAEKSSTNNLGLANMYDMTEEELRPYLNQILEEDVEGCEFWLSGYIIAEYEGHPVATGCGWLEGDNEFELPSEILKSNLLSYYFPKEKILKSAEKADIVKDIQLKREPGTYQWEFFYTVIEHRGHHLVPRIKEMFIQRGKMAGAKKLQGHVFANNIKSLKTYERLGFHIAEQKTSKNPLTKEYFPCDTIILMEKEF